MQHHESPLSDLRVLDFTRILSGPFCTALLSDLGAEVIKIELPEGDDYRAIGPMKNGESALFTAMNRNKKSMALNLKQPDAVALIREGSIPRPLGRNLGG
jgi:CoA:oxalate CoA-transferase